MFRSSLVVRIACLFLVLSLALSMLPNQSASGQTSTVQTPYVGIWISAQELAALPTSGTAWNALLNAANASAGTPLVSDQDSNNDVFVLAKALVYARTGNTKYRTEVIDHLQRAIGTEAGGRTLALGRNLVSYVIAADLVNLPAANPTLDQSFRSWLRKTLTVSLEGKTLISTQEERPNNWGTHAGASRAAVARYLGDQNELNRSATVLRGLLGERAVYSGFSYGDLAWQCDPSKPVGVNPKGCMKNGYSVDGALPEEMRRGGAFQMPPVETGYAWEALQGFTVHAMILHRAGYPAFEWSDRAILRAVQYLYNTINWPATGDDLWQVWLINSAYGTNFTTKSPAGYGKNMGFTDWTHSIRTTTNPTAVPTSAPTKAPTTAPTTAPTKAPTSTPTKAPTTAPTLAPTQAPTQAPTLGPITKTVVPVLPTATSQPVASATPASPSGGQVMAITFEHGSLVDPASGVDSVSGSVSLLSGSEIAGKYAARIANTNNAYLQENFAGQDTVYVSFLLKVHSLPSSATRILLISNGGDTIGNLVLNTDGSLKLRSASTSLGSNSSRLATNQIYKVGLYQKRGTGGNAVLQAFVVPVGQSFGAPFAAINNGAWTSQATFVRFGATMSANLDASFDNILINNQVMP